MDQYDSFLDDGDDYLFNNLSLPSSAQPQAGQQSTSPAHQPVIQPNPNRRLLGNESDKHAYDDLGFGNISEFVKNKRMKLHNQRSEDVRDLGGDFDQEVVNRQIFRCVGGIE